jgi:hypothetical protein
VAAVALQPGEKPAFYWGASLDVVVQRAVAHSHATVASVLAPVTGGWAYLWNSPNFEMDTVVASDT